MPPQYRQDSERPSVRPLVGQRTGGYGRGQPTIYTVSSDFNKLEARTTYSQSHPGCHRCSSSGRPATRSADPHTHTRDKAPHVNPTAPVLPENGKHGQLLLMKGGLSKSTPDWPHVRDSSRVSQADDHSTRGVHPRASEAVRGSIDLPPLSCLTVCLSVCPCPHLGVDLGPRERHRPQARSRVHAPAERICTTTPEPNQHG
jgi:hypothetical protein